MAARSLDMQRPHWNFFKAKDTQMANLNPQEQHTKTQITVHDYDHSALKPRSYSDQTLVFPAWIGDENEPTEVQIAAADFLEYCRETSLIHEDAHISKTISYISIPVEIPGFDAGRDEFFQAFGKPREQTFAEFFADFYGNGLTEALTRFLNDSRICAG